MKHLTGNKRLGQADRDLARVGRTDIAKSARMTAVLLANERVNDEFAAWCDAGCAVSDLREQRLRKREKKKMLAEAKASIYAALHAREVEMSRARK